MGMVPVLTSFLSSCQRKRAGTSQAARPSIILAQVLGQCFTGRPNNSILSSVLVESGRCVLEYVC